MTLIAVLVAVWLVIVIAAAQALLQLVIANAPRSVRPW
jgi:hypothetical protein